MTARLIQDYLYSRDTYTNENGIYVGGLPPDTIKDDLAGVIKFLGRVKNFDVVEVIRCDDVYWFGFVHFQSADSVKKAVEVLKLMDVKDLRLSHVKSHLQGAEAEAGVFG